MFLYVCECFEVAQTEWRDGEEGIFFLVACVCVLSCVRMCLCVSKSENTRGSAGSGMCQTESERGRTCVQKHIMSMCMGVSVCRCARACVYLREYAFIGLCSNVFVFAWFVPVV